MPLILRPAGDDNPNNWTYVADDPPYTFRTDRSEQEVGRVVWSSPVMPTADVTAPTLAAASGAADGATGFTGSVTTDEAFGTLYYAPYTGATEPSAAEVIAGTGGGIVDGAAGLQAVTATGVQEVADGGLTAETAYKIAYVHDDEASTPNISAVLSSAEFTTPAVEGSNLLTDSGFDDPDAWQTTGGWSIANGVATHTPGATGQVRKNGVELTPGATYRLSITVLNHVSGGPRFLIVGDSNAVSDYFTDGNGTYTADLTAPADADETCGIWLAALTTTDDYDCDDFTMVLV